VAGGVGELERVVLDVGVAVEGLGGVGLGKAAELGIVIAGLVEIQTRFVVDLLAGVAVGHVKRGGIVPVSLVAEGGVAVVLDNVAVAVLQFFKER
jgi:uncharacterized membrane protein (DUF441 family)